jgi:hypothetical protein
MSEQDSKYFARGWDAAKDGLELSDIPYHVDSYAGRIWLSGFYEYIEEFSKDVVRAN